MKPGKVIGRVTLSDAAPQFKGARWLVISPLESAQLSGADKSEMGRGWTPVIYDSLGAGTGDDILYVEGAEATQAFEYPIPLDALNVAILDNYEFKPEQ